MRKWTKIKYISPPPFSNRAYAAGRFPPTNNTSDCLFVPSSFAPGGDHVDTVFPAGAFIDQNMGPLIQVCRSGWRESEIYAEGRKIMRKRRR